MAGCRAGAVRFGRLVAVFTALVSGGTAGHAEETLRWTFKPGEAVRYEFHQANEVKVTVDGKENPSKTDLKIAMTWKVKAVTPEGAAEITMVVDRVRAEIETGASKILYNSADDKSADPAAQPLRDVYGAAVGSEYGLKVDPRGQVVEAHVPENVTKAVRGSPFVGVADGGSVLSEAGLKNLFAQVVPPLPDRAVKPGEAWKAELKLPTAPLAMTLTFRYKLDALDAASASIKASIASVLMPEPGTPFTVAVKDQSGSATYTFDRKAGKLGASGINQAVQFTLTFMNREIEQSISVSERMTLIR